jgi:hypothetical protein
MSVQAVAFRIDTHNIVINHDRLLLAVRVSHLLDSTFAGVVKLGINKDNEINVVRVGFAADKTSVNPLKETLWD